MPWKEIKDWDQYRYAFVKQSLRRATFRWPACSLARQAARTTQKINPATGRLCWHAKCALCGSENLEKELELDHVLPVVPTLSEASDRSKPEYIGGLVRRMFPEPSGWQTLCEQCHTRKTGEENEQRKNTRKRHKQDRQLRPKPVSTRGSRGKRRWG